MSWKKSANCEFNSCANLMVVAKNSNAHETISKHLTVKLEHVCQLSHLKSKQPTEFPRLSQTTGLVIKGGEKKGSLGFLALSRI